eukprot:TRINITY_DN6184_c0_g1_i1.p1 TRINITY_DN6184_c0_g1~~TRINITY_DN6184_c0_g1_i1.p1  ORF type:complete len:1113 (+),score=201.56 TRINITY_DN6184_c0_g1_i1:171-3509(+)
MRIRRQTVSWPWLPHVIVTLVCVWCCCGGPALADSTTTETELDQWQQEEADSMAAARAVCSQSSPWVGLVADLSMLQHQLRGTVEILDDCSFKVESFDMLPGKAVYWWGAESDSLEDLLNGWPVSKEPLLGTYNGQTMLVTLDNTTWDNMGILAVWSTATASDYGHILLQSVHSIACNSSSSSTNVPGSPTAGCIPSEGPPSGTVANVSSPPPPYSAPSTDGNGETDEGEVIDGSLGVPFPAVGAPPAAADGPLEAPIPEVSPGPMSSPSKEPGLLPPPQFPPPPPVGPEKFHGQWQPTMFENCMQLSHRFRVRWTLNEKNGSVDIGLEAAVDPTYYLGFGWAAPEEAGEGNPSMMVESDLTIGGYNEEGLPFVEDYYVTAKSECNWDPKEPSGVCPDSLYAGTDDVNNVKLVWGQHTDGITLLRYRRPLVSIDLAYDHPLNVTEEYTVIWALGSLRHPDLKNPRAAPTYHGVPQGSSYGVAVLTLGTKVDDCQSVLNGPSATAEVGPLLLVADRGTEFKVTSGAAVHYPNPPSPGRTLYVNGKETPALKVERGVPVVFSVQAGHTYPVYITSDPIGGSLNADETIYSGGEDAHGVPAAPFELEWTPNASTPDVVYYQAYTQPKMGWKVQVVDGGLSDMYSNSVALAGEKVTLFWTISGSNISFAARGEQPSGYVAVAFGSGMVNSFAYVGWIDEAGVGQLASYYIDSRDASGVHPSSDEFTMTKATQEDGGKLTFEWTRPLKPTKCGIRCSVIDPAALFKVVWSMGATWTAVNLSHYNMHSSMSAAPTLINLTTGISEIETLEPVFAVHGFMMFIAWGILMPLGVLSARYLRHQDWFRIHVYSQCSGIAIMVLGLLFAVGELQGFDFSSAHSKIGMVAISIGLWQPLNAFFRPPKRQAAGATDGEKLRLLRVVWQWAHILSGRIGLGVAAVALVSGLVTLDQKYRGDHQTLAGLISGVVAWGCALGALVVYAERQHSPADRWREEELIRSMEPLAGFSSSSSAPEWRNGKGGETLGEGDEESITNSRRTPPNSMNGNSAKKKSSGSREVGVGGSALQAILSTDLRKEWTPSRTPIRLAPRDGGSSNGGSAEGRRGNEVEMEPLNRGTDDER